MSHATEASRAEGRREDEAVERARQHLELRRQAVGEHHPDYAADLNQLALLLIMQGHAEDAEPLLRQALDIRQEVLGEKHPDYATNLSSLAGLLWARGDLESAEPLMRQALEIRWDVFGSNHPKTQASLNSLEQLLLAKQAWQGAEQLPAIDEVTAGPSASEVLPPANVEPEAATHSDPAIEAETPLEPVPSLPLEMPPPAVATEVPEPSPRPEGGEFRGEPAEVLAVTETPVHSEPTRRFAGTEEPGATNREGLIAAHGELTAQFIRVGEQLALAAEDWKGGGSPPDPALIEQLDACGHDFDRLRGRVAELSASLGAPIESSDLTNLEEIANLLHVLGEAEGRQAQLQAIQGQAVSRLDRVLSLSSADGKEFPALVECQARASALRSSIADASVLELPEEATRLAEGDHPFYALLTLVEGDGLDDDVWASSLETVEAEFGKALAVAVARSKIVQP